MIQSRTPPVVEDIYYPVSDGQPLGETQRHIWNMCYVLQPLEEWYAGDPWAFVAAIMFVYYEQGNNRRVEQKDRPVVLRRREKRQPRSVYYDHLVGKVPQMVDFIVPKTRQPRPEKQRNDHHPKTREQNRLHGN